VIRPIQVLAAPVLAVVLFASFTYSVYSLYPGLTKRGDWARVAAYLHEHESLGQPIIVFDTFDSLALRYYYRGSNKVLPDEKFFAWQQLDGPSGSETSHRSEIDFVISGIPPDSNEIWLLVNEKCLATKACVPLENFVKSNYTIVEEKEFYIEKVFLLRKIKQ
jgi:hypothetical protein